MKLLVFAHKPPPHHGQSYMVQLLLGSFGGDARARPAPGPRAIQCYHVDARVSKDMEDLGRMRAGKAFSALKYCAQAIWYRFRYGVRNFYYIPAPPNLRSALFRDWLVMALCRPFFPNIILHWHAAGLGDWLQNAAPAWQRKVTMFLLGRPSLSIVLSEFNRSDATQLQSRKVVVVPNGIPDPCPNFESDVLPRRLARAQARTTLLSGAASAGRVPLPGDSLAPAGPAPDTFQVLFIGMCSPAKGLFDAVEAVALLQKKWAAGPLRVQLTVAGKFAEPADREQFDALLRKYNYPNSAPLVRYLGFVSGEEKARLFAESDCLCFPTWYTAESFGLVLVEAMACGLPIVTTRWRMIPEVLPKSYPGLVEPHAPEQVCAALEQVATTSDPAALRQHYLANFTQTKFAERIQAVLTSRP